MLFLRLNKAQTILWTLSFLTGIIVFLFLALRRIHQPLAGDDLWVLVAAETLHTTGIPQIFHQEGEVYFHHPLLYIYLLAWMFKGGAPYIEAGRLLNIFSALLSIFLVFIIVKILSKDDDKKMRVSKAILASLLYALSPTTIQGTTMIQIDTSILIPLILFFTFVTIQYFQTMKRSYLLLISLTLALALWTRLSTTILSMILVFIYGLINKIPIKAKVNLITAFFCGIILFLSSWYIFCQNTHISFIEPFQYTFSHVISAEKSFQVSNLITNIFYLLIWLCPFFLLTIIAVAIKQIKVLPAVFSTPGVFLTFLGGGILFTYIFVGGVTFAYPRYHSPAIPLLYAALALLLSSKEFEGMKLKNIIFIVLLSLCIQIFILGDMLYLVRFTLKDYILYQSSELFGVLQNAAFPILIALAIYSLIFLTFRKILSSQNLVGFLILLAVGHTLGMTTLQSLATYNTGYNYGEEGRKKVVQFLKEKIPSDKIVLGPNELMYALYSSPSRYLPNSFWRNAEELQKKLGDPQVYGLVYSITTNTLDQIRTIKEDKAVQEILHQQFIYASLGSYEIWRRR